MDKLKDEISKLIDSASGPQWLSNEIVADKIIALTTQKDAVADVRCNEGSSANADMGTKTKNYDYEDMLAAFTAGRRHHKECADSLDDCWDFATWIKEGYGT